MRSYGIGQLSRMFNLPISTIRYYDNVGLFPDMKCYAGRRLFTVREIEALRVIECLKASGLEIKEIKQFMTWCREGSPTYAQRKQFFEDRKKAVEEKLNQLKNTLDLMKYECWYYDTALRNGEEFSIRSMLPNNLPSEIQELYDSGFKSAFANGFQKMFIYAFPNAQDNDLMDFLKNWL